MNGDGELSRSELRRMERTEAGRTLSPNGDCPHGNCCESFGYVLSFIQWILDNSPKDSVQWDTAARIMDEVGK